MESPLKFQQLNSELSHTKHTQEVSKSDLQSSENLTGMLIGYVYCVTTQN